MQINLHQLLVDLEGLRAQNGFDPEDRALMLQYEIEVANYEALLALKQNPVFLGLLAEFEKEIQRINTWILVNTKELLLNPDKQREGMFLQAKKEVLESFVNHYKKEPTELIRHIRERVDEFVKN